MSYNSAVRTDLTENQHEQSRSLVLRQYLPAVECSDPSAESVEEMPHLINSKPCDSDYSCRNNCAGSMRVAREAGIALATVATASRKIAPPMNVIGSTAEI